MGDAVLAELQAIRRELGSLSSASLRQDSRQERFGACLERLVADVADLRQYVRSYGPVGITPTQPRLAQETGSGGAEVVAGRAAPAPPPQALPAEAAAAGPADDENLELAGAPGDGGFEVPPGSPPAASLERLPSMQRDADAAAAAVPRAGPAGSPAELSLGGRRRRHAPALARPARRLAVQSVGTSAAQMAARVPAVPLAAAAHQQGSAERGHTFVDDWVWPPNRVGWYENFTVAALPAVALGGCWRMLRLQAGDAHRLACLDASSTLAQYAQAMRPYVRLLSAAIVIKDAAVCGVQMAATED